MFLREPSRPPSRGGNTGALHSHVLRVDGEDYSFLARGSQQWVHKSDTVSFDYVIQGRYRNILPATLMAIDRHGRRVARGNRTVKPQLRTVAARLPASRRERRD